MSEPPASNEVEPTPEVFIRAVVVFYSLMVIAGFAWTWARGLPPIHLAWRGGSLAWWLQLLIGVGFGLVVVQLGKIIERRFEFARRLSDELTTLIPALNIQEVVIAAFFSSIAEEVFFRGAMQDALGFWLTAAAFMVVHGFFERRYMWWMIFAGVMGMAFGWMMLALGTLIAPVAAHFTINAINLRILVLRRREVAL